MNFSKKILSKIVSCTFFLAIFSACNPGSSNDESFGLKPRQRIMINTIDTTSVLYYSSVYDSVKIIPLETTPESLIGKIRRIVFTGKYFMIMDNREANSLFIFDNKGKYIRKIGKPGKGPGEYGELTDFAFDEYHDLILILDNSLGKILRFDLNGTFKDDVLISDQIAPSSMSVLNKDTYAFYIDKNYKDFNNKPFNVFTYSLSNKKIKKYFPVTKTMNALRGSMNYFYSKDSTLFCSPGFSGNIYKFGKDSLSLEYSIEFVKNSIPKDFFSKYENMDFHNALLHEEFAYLSTYFDFDNYLMFRFVFKGVTYTAFYSKKSKKVTYARIGINDIEGVLTGIDVAAYENYVISYLESFAVEQLKAYLLDKKFIKVGDKKINFSPEEVRKIISVNSTQNPVIIVKKVK